ncbi:putative nuclease HARBI1 isoform X2 [Rhagoletis pomonella]|uniref:putative nuclease HARBI1 isoform X2 n=1 Tax=Rhagoletis pomonella TaxID=28610 RepID=UPI0017820C79|nr:putative nuclease HARBI1 isoform X2 [Rhagoletis pomonella]
MAPSRHMLCIEALKKLKNLQKIIEERRKRKKHKFWVNPFLAQRGLHDLEANLLKDILWEEGQDFNNFCRMSIDQFNEILSKIPATEKEWLDVANDFETLWQFPHTLGAIDGKHIRIKAPPRSGSDFHNYKGFFSIILLAVVDAHSRFIYVDIGANGRASDVMAFKNSLLYDNLSRGQLNLPADKPLKGQLSKTPFYFIGDDIFGLNRHLMKAYNRSSNLSTAQEAYNYRLSRARMTVEMAFGRLSSRFRVFHRPIEVSVETCDTVVKACCILHNYLARKLAQAPNPQQDISNQVLPSTISSLPVQEQNTYKYACKTRDNICKYCITDGDVPYQWHKIKKQVPK